MNWTAVHRAYSVPCQTSKVRVLEETVNDLVR